MFHLFTKVLSLLTIYIDFVHQTFFTKRTKNISLPTGKNVSFTFGKCFEFYFLHKNIHLMINIEQKIFVGQYFL